MLILDLDKISDGQGYLKQEIQDGDQHTMILPQMSDKTITLCILNNINIPSRPKKN